MLPRKTVSHPTKTGARNLKGVDPAKTIMVRLGPVFQSQAGRLGLVTAEQFSDELMNCSKLQVTGRISGVWE